MWTLNDSFHYSCCPSPFTSQLFSSINQLVICILYISMESTVSMLPHKPFERTDYLRDNGPHHFFDSDQTKIPKQFICPKENLAHANEIFKEPVVDLEGFLKGDIGATHHAAEQIRAACMNHGFFQVINHGVDLTLIRIAHDHVNAFFKLPIYKKMKAQKKPGSMWGYSSAHLGRFSSNVTCKETLSFGFQENGSGDLVVKDFFESALGKEFESTGLIYQKYCESMKQLSLSILEILGISLGIDPSHYREFFEDSSSIMRCNYYPPCKEPGLALGTGPHCDPTSLTILHQDQVGGLEVFVDNKWKSVQPRYDQLVINIGDTFTALSNGIYKSCLHRAVVNKNKERISLTFFLCPKEDKVVKPPQDLISRSEGQRKYPDFKWSNLLHFTQNHHRADATTLQNFIHWLKYSKQEDDY